jgi:hypothetical protein
MAKEERLVRVVIVNKFGPFDKDITGKSLWQLGRHLEQHGCSLQYICVRESTKSNVPAIANRGDAKVKYVPRIGLGNKPVMRLAAAVIECFLLFFRSLFTKSDVMIVMSAPAMMNWWGIWLKKLTGRRIVFWTMDIFPEAFTASGLVKDTGRLFLFLQKIIYRNPPGMLIALGEQQKSCLQSKYKFPIETVVLPCGIQKVVLDPTPPSWIREEDQGKIKFCYAGNLGEAHDENFVIALAQSLDPKLHRFYINLYGTKAAAVLPQIEELPAVQKISFLPYTQMHHLDVHVASLLSQYDHVCVPSKAVSAVCTGAVLLLNSSNRCDAWHMFRSAAFWVPQQSSGYRSSIAEILRQINVGSISEKRTVSLQLAEDLQGMQQKAFEEIAAYMSKTVGRTAAIV